MAKIKFWILSIAILALSSSASIKGIISPSIVAVIRTESICLHEESNEIDPFGAS